MKNVHLYVLSALLVAAGLGLFLFKAALLNFPVLPGKTTATWNVEAQVSFTARGQPVKISLNLPRNNGRYSITRENYISRGFGVTTGAVDGRRAATWTIRTAKGMQHLYYSATIRRVEREDPLPASAPKKPIEPVFNEVHREAVDNLIVEIRAKSADLGSLVSLLIDRINQPRPGGDVELLLEKEVSTQKKIELAVNVLSLLGVHARPVHGIRLTDRGRNIPLVHWMEVFDRDRWVPYDFDTGQSELPEDYFPWWHGFGPIVQAEGAQNVRAELSSAVNQEDAVRSAGTLGKISRPVLQNFSIFGLPLQLQSVYRVLLLVPVGVLFLVILRNLVGFKTFGTFMPVLIALAFRETRLLWGLFLFTVLVAAGMGVRLYLEHLKLLVVPRLAAMLTVVILLMLALSVLTHRLGLERGLSVALFPMVIIAMTIERMSIIWDEVGPGEAVAQGAGTMLAAAVAYYVMSIKLIEHLVFIFPELLFVVLGVMILLGRYTGYRLLEIRRFRGMSER